MKIVTISDTHGKHEGLDNIEADLIIHAGDCTRTGRKKDIEDFLQWYSSQKADKKILVAGNHDWGFERSANDCEVMCENYGITYLYDTSCEYKGLKIWGSPVQPEFNKWAFNRARDLTEAAHKQIPDIKPHWDKIPNDVDILITHGPPYGILDEVLHVGINPGKNVGCHELRKKVEQVNPSLHVFGHIHESRGIKKTATTTYVNAAVLDLSYQLYPEDPFSFDWNKIGKK